MIEIIKKRLTHRIRIISGQISGLEKMIKEEKYCLDIIGQSLAIQKSLASLNKLLLENHVRTHLVHQLSSKDEQEVEKAVQEMVKLYELNVKNGEVNVSE
jgi:DNA-binding FrmR family transcriptional regulator